MPRSVVPKPTHIDNCSFDPSQFISNALVVFMVQCFFIRRIWVLSEYKHWMAGILSVIAFITLGAAMFFGIKDAGHQLFSGFRSVSHVSPVLRASL